MGMKKSPNTIGLRLRLRFMAKGDLGGVMGKEATISVDNKLTPPHGYIIFPLGFRILDSGMRDPPLNRDYYPSS